MTISTHLSSCFIIMQIHETPFVAFQFSGVEKLPGEPHPEADVHAAPAPLPPGGRRLPRLWTWCTPARGYVAPGARRCHCVGNAGARYSVCKCRFSWTCNYEEKKSIKISAERNLTVEKVTRGLHITKHKRFKLHFLFLFSVNNWQKKNENSLAAEKIRTFKTIGLCACALTS